MIIFHGDDQVSSRQAFLSVKDTAKKSGSQIVDFVGYRLTLPDLATALSTVSLLGSVNAVFVEEFFSRRPSNEKKAVADYLKTSSSSEIYLWESKDQSLQLKAFSPELVRKFELPKYVFKFLESFSLNYLQMSLKSVPPDQILALLSGHLHRLLLVKSGSGELPGWQLAKLKIQSDKYSLSQLAAKTHALLSIDYRHKNSLDPFDLSAALEIWTLT